MEAEEELEWRAAIGRNADRYLRFFRKLAPSGKRWMPSWNLAAFLNSTGWFCYRRMYGWALVNLLAPWLLLIVLTLASGVVPSRAVDGLLIAVLVAYLAGVFIFVPVFADSLYYRNLAGRLTRARPPSLWTGLGAAALTLASFAIVLAMLLPAYGDYTPRAKMSEAILSSSTMRSAVTEFHRQHRRLPDAAEAKGFTHAPPSARVRLVAWDAGLRAIVVTLSDPFPGKRFALRAVIEDGELSWKCGPVDIDEKEMPGSCRD